MFQPLTEATFSWFADTPRASLKIDQKRGDRRSMVLFQESSETLQLKDITKVKIRSEKGHDSMFFIKITDKTTDHLSYLSKRHQIQCFLSILKAKIAEQLNIQPLEEDYVNHCEGTISKKSFFGNMEQNYVFISKIGLTASQSKESHFDLYIDRIKELWTRFEVINDKTEVIFKTRYHLVKYQFGVPVKHCLKWAKAFCSLLQYQ